MREKGRWRCVRCGRCCRMFGSMIPASDRDIARWEREGRQDILDRVRIARDPRTGRIMAAECWFEPATGRPSAYCPWIRKRRGGAVECAIHGTKPQYCRDYVCGAHPG